MGDLKSDIQDIKKKVRNFAMAVKGRSIVLLIQKKKITDMQENDLRKELKGAQVFSGTCGPEGAEAVNFLFADVDAVPVEAGVIKKHIAKETQLRLSVGVGLLNDAAYKASVSDDDDGMRSADDASEDDAPPPSDQKAPDSKANLKDLRAELKAAFLRAAAAYKSHPALAKKSLPIFTKLKADMPALAKSEDTTAISKGISDLNAFAHTLENTGQKMKLAPVDKDARAKIAFVEGDTAKLAAYEAAFGGAAEMSKLLKDTAAEQQRKYDAFIKQGLEDEAFNVKPTSARLAVAIEAKFLDAYEKQAKDRANAVDQKIVAAAPKRLSDAEADCAAANAKDPMLPVLMAEFAALEQEKAEYNITKDTQVAGMDLRPDKSKGDTAMNREKGVKSERDTMISMDPLVVLAAKTFDLKGKVVALQTRLEKKIKKGTKSDSRKLATDLRTKVETLEKELADIFSSGAKMRFSEQNMVPSATDKDAIVAREDAKIEGITDMSQAWALVAVDLKGAEEREHMRVMALEALDRYNAAWATSYSEADLDKILSEIVTGKMATNYDFGKTPGEKTNLAKDLQGETQLTDLLVADTNFRNLWEVGESQASKDTNRRGGVEEQMGYSAPLNRVDGDAHTVTNVKGETGAFDPKDADKGKLPKYAGVAGELRADTGGAPRYGKSFVVWKKEAIEDRISMAPGDSWSKNGQGVERLTGPGDPEVLFVKSDEILIRAIAAIATGKDQKWLADNKDKVAKGHGYIETQIHGDLTWEHVEEVVVREDDDTIVAKFQALAKNYDFTVRKA